MKRMFFGMFILAVALVATSGVSYAQTAPSAELDKNMALMRKDLRSGKKQLIAANVPLTDVEATKFWPIYDQYAGEMSKQYDQLLVVIKEYAANQMTLTDAQAMSLVKKSGDIQAGMQQVRQKYVPLVEKAIPGKKAALFFQIDRRLHMLMDLQIASEVPLVIQP